MTVENPPLRRGAALLAVGLSSLLFTTPAPVFAETVPPSPGPSSSATAEVTPGATASPSPTARSTPSSSSTGSPLPVTPSPAPSTPVPPSPAPSSPAPSSPAPSTPVSASPERAAAAALTLRVLASGSPVAGQFYEDIGQFAFSGTATGIAEGARLEVYRRAAGSTAWNRVAQASVSQGLYSASLLVQAKGVYTFVTTTGGASGSGDGVASPQATVTVRDSSIGLDKPASSVDALTSPTLRGSVVPARAGVVVHLDVRRGSSFRPYATARTDPAGRFRVSFGHGVGHLDSYTVRATQRMTNRPRWEISDSRTVRRVAVLNAVTTATTAAEVAKTYRRGCPVGRSRLRTITMNYYARDKLMHRGVLIIRTDLVPEIKRAFDRSLAARYPFAKMRNPNDYGGNDPRQMEANNTSGFNCRKVVGNPYAQSPHSYGIAIDVNTVQNPYRDSSGKWWPSNGKPYIDRTPLRLGMLGTGSTLTRQLRSDGFFWGGLWSPGRDYQHFEYRR